MGRKRKIALRVVGGLVVAVLGWVGYVQLTYARNFDTTTPRPALKASQDPKVIADGAYVVNAIAHCGSCHGNAEAAQNYELPADQKDMRGGWKIKAGPFGTFYPANLTPHNETGLGKMSDADLARVLRHGVSPEGRLDPLMMFAVGPIADEDLVAMMSYLRSLPPIDNRVPPDEWGFVAKALAGRFNPRMLVAPKYVPPGQGASKERGDYLANGPAACFSCHTPRNPKQGFEETGPRFSGAGAPDPDHFDPEYELMAPNLTPDPETGALTNFTEDQFVDRIKKVGAANRGSRMPWANFKQLTDDDVRSLYRYLQSVPPVKRATGPTRRKRGSK